MKFGRKATWMLGLFLLCGIVVYFLIQYSRAGLFPRSKLEAVVAQLHEKSLEPGQIHRFRIDRFPDPASLRPLKDDEYVNLSLIHI